MSDVAAQKTQEDEKKLQDSPIRHAILNQKSGILAEDNAIFNRRVSQK